MVHVGCHGGLKLHGLERDQDKDAGSAHPELIPSSLHTEGSQDTQLFLTLYLLL